MAEQTLQEVLKKIRKDYGDSVVKVGVESLDIDGILSLGSPSFDFCIYGGIPEGRICATITEMLNIEGIVLEPAGALSIDALKDVRDQIVGKNIVCITSGGNFDFERLPDIKERALRFEGLKKYFILRMPQRPGALKDFLNLLGPNDDIARFEYLKKSARNFGSVLLGIESGSVEGFNELCKRMKDNGFSYEDITDDDVLAQILI